MAPGPDICTAVAFSNTTNCVVNANVLHVLHVLLGFALLWLCLYDLSLECFTHCACVLRVLVALSRHQMNMCYVSVVLVKLFKQSIDMFLVILGT